MTLAEMKTLEMGGAWLGACRSYLQNHCPGGDSLIWGSLTPVNITAKQIEELALRVAAAAITADRASQRRPGSQP